MKKKMLLFAAGLAAALLVAGCGKKTAETPDVKDDTVAPEVQESTPEQGEGENGLQGEAQDDSMGEAVAAPVKIWGTVTGVEDNVILVDNKSENSSAGEFVLNVDFGENRVIDAVTGFPASIDEIEMKGFEAYLGEAVTMSLPPQNNPVLVLVNVPEDGKAPQYAVAAAALREEDDAYVLEATDGRSYQVPKDAETLPFLTRNIVSLEDIAEGTECLIWLDGEGRAEKVVLFAQ